MLNHDGGGDPSLRAPSRCAAASLRHTQVTNAESFSHVADWLTEVNRYASESTCKLLVGNKNDMENKQVTSESAKEYADSLGIPFLETSAKSAANIEEAFLTMAAELIRIREKQQTARGGGGGGGGMKLGGGKSGGKKSCC